MTRAQLQKRALWLTLGWCYVALIVYLSLTSHPPEVMTFEHGDKVKHFCAYFLLLFWFGQLYTRAMTRVMYFLLFEAMGVTLEFLQAAGGTRVFEINDMLANTAGLALGLLVVALGAGSLLKKVERRYFSMEQDD
jgi:VanZ family protein